jgi:DNA-binding winged helix-turn-helix (wHTH) protein
VAKSRLIFQIVPGEQGYKLFCNGKRIKIWPLIAATFLCLVLRAGTFTTRADIIDFTYPNHDDPPFDRSVYLHLTRLRPVLKRLGLSRRLICYPTRGYKFDTSGISIKLSTRSPPDGIQRKQKRHAVSRTAKQIAQRKTVLEIAATKHRQRLRAASAARAKDAHDADGQGARSGRQENGREVTMAKNPMMPPQEEAGPEKSVLVGLEPSRQMKTQRAAPTPKMDAGTCAGMSGKMQPFTEEDC